MRRAGDGAEGHGRPHAGEELEESSVGEEREREDMAGGAERNIHEEEHIWGLERGEDGQYVDCGDEEVAAEVEEEGKYDDEEIDDDEDDDEDGDDDDDDNDDDDDDDDDFDYDEWEEEEGERRGVQGSAIDGDWTVSSRLRAPQQRAAAEGTGENQEPAPLAPSSPPPASSRRFATLTAHPRAPGEPLRVTFSAQLPDSGAFAPAPADPLLGAPPFPPMIHRPRSAAARAAVARVLRQRQEAAEGSLRGAGRGGDAGGAGQGGMEGHGAGKETRRVWRGLNAGAGGELGDEEVRGTKRKAEPHAQAQVGTAGGVTGGSFVGWGGNVGVVERLRREGGDGAVASRMAEGETQGSRAEAMREEQGGAGSMMQQGAEQGGAEREGGGQEGGKQSGVGEPTGVGGVGGGRAMEVSPPRSMREPSSRAARKMWRELVPHRAGRTDTAQTHTLGGSTGQGGECDKQAVKEELQRFQRGGEQMGGDTSGGNRGEEERRRGGRGGEKSSVMPLSTPVLAAARPSLCVFAASP
ncbi:unnamed protein product [Closterium sp. Naga37s-1]|nr:unnamed protein product [Closterium sp. Naga37s-1]